MGAMRATGKNGFLDRIGLLIVGGGAAGVYYVFERELHANNSAILITILIVLGISGLTQVLVNNINSARSELERANANLERKVRERTEALRSSELKYRTIFENTGTATVIVDESLSITLANTKFLKLSGCSAAQIDARKSLADFIDEKTRRAWSAPDLAAEDGEPGTHLACQFVDASGMARDVLLTIAPIPETNARVASLTDISELKEAERRIYFQAFHDNLTGLANRALFMEHLMAAMKRARSSGGAFAVLYLDIDRFKLINDSLGHTAGDALLSAFAERIRRVLREADILARLGGDEFAILVEHEDAPRLALEIAERLKQSLHAPFAILGKEVYAPASFGIVTETARYEQPEAVIRDADAAMYHAKESGRSQIKLFDSTLHEKATRQLQQETDLRKAIEQNQFLNHYQPIVHLGTLATTGWEALVRWQHPEAGLIEPGAFIPTAEEAGLIVPITRRIVEQACRDLRGWREAMGGAAAFTVNVNISSRHFQRRSLLEDFRAILEATGLSPSCLNIEITETALMDDADECVRLAHRLRELGFGLVIDDFGTGYSSLSYLQRLPISTLKVDRSFIARIEDGPGGDHNIVEAIISLAHKLGMKVVAEGIETHAQRTLLKSLGCEYGQGFLFAPPLPKERVDAWIAAHARGGVPAVPLAFPGAAARPPAAAASRSA
jgi:diguanylate cyclase (GGDEF)-like protein/PAS domain S-box-containing protein